ncbi:MAG: dihydrolipoyl dehydrogenase [Myxococcota bacterium]
MARTITIPVPDIGDFEDVDVIEVLVSVGDRVEVESPLITLESDKATMEIPSPAAGVVRELLVAVDQQVSQGTPIAVLEVAEDAAPEPSEPEPEEMPEPEAQAEAPSAPSPAPAEPRERPAGDQHAEVLVIGAGPGGNTAAFRAADLGRQVVLVERHSTLGGVCLNVGCIPSKALLHAADVIHQAGAMASAGITFGDPSIDFGRLRGHKDEVVGRLTQGLAKLAKQRKVEVVTGEARLAGAHLVRVETSDGTRSISFDHAILAVGSRPASIPGLPDDPRILDSTSALEVEAGVERLLVIGGGIIGLEMAAVYDALGSRVTVVELLPSLLPGADPDLVRPLARGIGRRYAGVHLETKVTRIEALEEGLRAHFEGAKAPEPAVFDRVLVAVGRTPLGAGIGAEEAGVRVDERGFIPTDAQCRTNLPHVYAIGDVAGEPQLAHKATHEGVVAAEAIAGLPAAFDALVPSVAYTDPEVAWVGLTETDAARDGTAYEKASFPWTASGRALGIGRSDGLTKLLFDPETKRVLGAGIVGPSAGDLISEATLAIEMGADVEDLALTVHPHPTLSETVGFAAEMAAGTITDLYVPPKKKKKG